MKFIKLMMGLVILILIIGCSQQKLTIFYDENYSSTATDIRKQLNKEQTELVIELKTADFYHDFKKLTLIHGAEIDWQPIADIVHQTTGHYPSIFPAAIGKHYYRAGHLGLYLVQPYQQQWLYSCLADDAFFEIKGKPGQSPLEVTVLGYEEAEDEDIMVNNVDIQQDVITYSQSVVGDIKLRAEGDNYSLNSKYGVCRLYLRSRPTGEAVSG